MLNDFEYENALKIQRIEEGLVCRISSSKALGLLPLLLAAAVTLAGCGGSSATPWQQTAFDSALLKDTALSAAEQASAPHNPEPAPPAPAASSPEQLRAALGIAESLRPSLDHGPKPAINQRYIVLHDTEGSAGPEDVISWWENNGNLVAAHFVVGIDGHIAQCVPLDRIAHHAGFGNGGHNELYGIVEDGRDNLLGTMPIGSAYPDYALNAWSIGIEMVHIGGNGGYPEEQLQAVDGLIAYLDAVFANAPNGNAGAIIDHKAWRSTNSDTSPEFAQYLVAYQERRVHN